MTPPTPSEALAEDEILEAYRKEFKRTDDEGNLFHHSAEDVVVATVRKVIAALRARPPEGMVLVPKEPTKAMMNALLDFASAGNLNGIGWEELYKKVYRTMLAAYQEKR